MCVVKLQPCKKLIRLLYFIDSALTMNNKIPLVRFKVKWRLEIDCEREWAIGTNVIGTYFVSGG